MVYLVSYQHSGNTWLRYCIEYLKKCPTWGHREFSISERKSNFLDINLKNKPICIKRHEFPQRELNLNDIFLLILRNPYECIKKSQDQYKEFLRWFSLILEFDNFKGEKKCLYFEDIFDASIMNILDEYFDINEERKIDLLRNFNNHKQNCLSIYNNRTKEEGNLLKNIPEIYFTHDLLQRYR